MSSTCSEIVWLRGLLGELSVPQLTPTPLHADNTSAIQIAANPVFHERTKHISPNILKWIVIPFVKPLLARRLLFHTFLLNTKLLMYLPRLSLVLAISSWLTN
jgi:hypothetical protein